jgi:ubiquinone/menaquinone biosynthesis C-methylase UbiE
MADFDLSRMKKEYRERHRRLAGSEAYSLFNFSNLFTIQQRERRILHVLRKNGIKDLSNKKILEVGCGSGNVLLEFIQYGANPKIISGVDLLSNRLVEAQEKLPHSLIINADGQYLPFVSNFFDFALQFTAFSSVLNKNIRRNMAKDMLRVIKQHGIILWFDFWLNPTNPQTHGIAPREIRELFPNCVMEFQKITLAPPITRALVPFSWPLAQMLESLTILNSHYLVLIKKSHA